MESSFLDKWATQQTIEILTNDGDDWALERIQNESKKDDMADVVTQYEAFCAYFDLDQYTYEEKTTNRTKVKIVRKIVNPDPLIATRPKINKTSSKPRIIRKVDDSKTYKG